MRIGRVIGNVTLSCVHETLAGGRFRLAVPLMLDDLRNGPGTDAEELVVYDELSAGEGHLIAISEGGEAAMPFRPEAKPIDAYNAAILDDVAVQIDVELQS